MGVKEHILKPTYVCYIGRSCQACPRLGILDMSMTTRQIVTIHHLLMYPNVPILTYPDRTPTRVSPNTCDGHLTPGGQS
jgi:hypothetical protein